MTAERACAPPGAAVLPQGAELGSGLQHRRRYLPREAETLDGVNGNGWIITSWPVIHYSPVTYDGYPEAVTVKDGRGEAARFERREDGYVTRDPARWQLEIGGDVTEVRREDGLRWRFFGFESPQALCGKLMDRLASGGVVAIAEYDRIGRLLFLEETHPACPDQKIGLYYVYAESQPHRDRLLRVEKRRTERGESIPLSLSTFSYHSGRDAFGRLNDLRTAVSWRYDSALDLWRSGGFSYYRYYTRFDPPSVPSGLQFELGPDDVARMARDGLSPFDADDETLARYAARHCQYDSGRRIAFRAVNGGADSIHFRYLASDATPGRNWARRVIETHSDGREITAYYDEHDAVVLQAARDAAGRLTITSAPASADRSATGASRIASERERAISHSPCLPAGEVAALIEPRTPWENYTLHFHPASLALP